MKYRASLLLFLLRFPGAPFTLGQEPDPAVPNWPAPATWSPPRSHAGLTMMGEVTNPLPFIGVSPCRILDTRGNGAPIQGGIFTGGSDVRTYSLAGICGIPAEAQAISLNFTVTGPGQTTAGFLTAWPASGPVPPVSILNWDRVPEQIANAAVVPTSSSASIKVNVSAPTHVVVDVNGYYAGSGVGAANTFLGSNAGNFTMTGAGYTAVASNTFSSNTTGGDNTAVGYYALYVNSAGVGNVAVGYEALRNQTAGTGNVAIGQYAGSS